MIQVTLQFTSVAAAIAALAQIDNPAVVVTPTLTAATGNGVPPGPASSPKPPTPSPTSSPKPSESPAPAAAADTTTADAAVLEYEKDVKPIVIKVGAAGKRDALVELLKKFNVAKGPEVPADKLPAFKADLEALLA